MFTLYAVNLEINLVNALLSPECYPDKPSRIAYIETHISHVFVGDDYVYKIKKPVNMGFLDFSTLKKRYISCLNEVKLNSRLAGGIYIDVVPIYRQGNAYSFHKSNGGRIAEYAVKMKRIADENILYNLIGEGKSLYGELEETGHMLALFHNDAEIYRGTIYGGLKSIISATGENFEQIKPYCGVTIEEPFYSELVEYTRQFIREHDKTFSKRVRDGYIKEGHGDLHTQHICLSQPPVIFDCIEFNKQFRIIDVLQDIAFIFMDLEYWGRFDLSARLLKAYKTYLHGDPDEDLLRFYKVYRAIVRGKVNGFLLHDSKDEDVKLYGLKMAIDYFKLAENYLHNSKTPFNPVVIMGLSGSGKSAIAKDFARDWIILRSDEIRKELAGVKPDKHAYTEYGAGIYTEEMTEKIYSLLLNESLKLVREGKRVVVDATYLQSRQRMDFYSACMERGFNPFFIHCFASEEVLKERIRKRMEEGTDLSDAHLEILARQIDDQEEPVELPYFRVLRLNTEDALHNSVSALKEFL